MKPDFSDIFLALMGANGRAQAFSESHPEHDQVIGRLIKEINRITSELKNDLCECEPPMLMERTKVETSFHEQAILHDLVNFLMVARAFANHMSERKPEYVVPLKRFQEELWRIQNELVRTLLPGWLSNGK